MAKAKHTLIALVIIILIGPVNTVFAGQLIWHKQAQLTGILSVEKHYGPPNYGETPDIDRLEIVWILNLDQPVIATGKAYDDAIETSQPQTRIQLLSLPRESQIAGHCITVTGEIFAAISGHHRTPILMDIVTIEQCEQ